MSKELSLFVGPHGEYQIPDFMMPKPTGGPISIRDLVAEMKPKHRARIARAYERLVVEKEDAA